MKRHATPPSSDSELGWAAATLTAYRTLICRLYFPLSTSSAQHTYATRGSCAGKLTIHRPAATAKMHEIILNYNDISHTIVRKYIQFESTR